ncbi:hypothetical protein V2J09_006928 [Rumex salicifolius]
MGKNDKTGLGRALVKKHNHMVQLVKEKGKLQRKKVLESITEVTDIETVIENAEEAELLFDADHPIPNLPIDLDGNSSASGLTSDEWRERQLKEEALHASSIRVPRRPKWNANMSTEELDINEKQSFLIWRRGLAKLEENDRLVLTPFEKNLDIWRQLWRVIERSDLLVTVVDARDPMFYRCPDLEAYVKEVDEHKRTLLLMNKADLLPYDVRVKWATYFHDHGILSLFWSAKAATATLEGKNPTISREMESIPEDMNDMDVKIYGRDELLARLQSEAEDIVFMRTNATSPKTVSESSFRSSGAVTVGFVGYPNVGKSSTINALVGQKCTGVTSTPGKTKHFQTLIISDKLTLCDCPGLVFPSFTSSRYEMIACGVLPIDRMTAHRDAVQVVANRVPRRALETVYKISLPKPKSYEPQTRPPSASELLRAYCASRGYVGSSGLPDETKAARQMLKDYVDGKLPHFELPPGMSYEEEEENETTSESDESDAENSLADTDASGSVPQNVMNDLDSFDIVNGMAPEKENKVKKKTLTAPHKQHKKPQRKKDRSWRAANYDGDGMPVVRVFQKPVNTVPA